VFVGFSHVDLAPGHDLLRILIPTGKVGHESGFNYRRSVSNTLLIQRAGAAHVQTGGAREIHDEGRRQQVLVETGTCHQEFHGIGFIQSVDRHPGMSTDMFNERANSR